MRPLNLALLALAVAIGCSAIVDPRDPEPRCEITGVNARQVCPEGLQCIEGRCQKSCVGVIEVCNDNIDNDCDKEVDEVDPMGRDTCGDGIDNDCDNVVDEGSDFDHDGYSWCGNTLPTDGGHGSIDCDDLASDVYPGAPEICDGRDNDCNGVNDDEPGGAPLCPDGQFCFAQRCVVASCANEGPGVTCGPNERCDAITGKCVSRQCATDTCATDEYCDTATNTCKPRARQPNGSACASAADCLSNSCIDAAALRFAESGRVCGQACCDDSQCKEGERCFASGTGARSCLPLSLLPPTAPRDCLTDDACGRNELCALSRDQSLNPPQYVERDDVITSSCVASTPTFETGERCTLYPECASRVCVPGVLFGNLCSNPCGTSDDCKALDRSVRLMGGAGAYCRFVAVTLDGSPADYAAVCVVSRGSDVGMGIYGAPCSTGRDCLEGGCVDATGTTKGQCTPTCCSDDQCGPREDGKDVVCRPFAFGDRYEMRCDI